MGIAKVVFIGNCVKLAKRKIHLKFSLKQPVIPKGVKTSPRTRHRYYYSISKITLVNVMQMSDEQKLNSDIGANGKI